jgi:hypothetical protein
MVLKLRIAGWLAFLTGMALFFFSGGLASGKNPLVWVGLFTALGGMFLTSTANLVAHLQKMKRLKESVRKDSPSQTREK